MTQYRVRRGLFGKSVLQELLPAAPMIMGHGPLPARWIDVPYSEAPRAFVQIKIPESITVKKDD